MRYAQRSLHESCADGSGILYVCELPEISMAMTQQWYNQDMGNVAFESQEELIAFKLGITLDPESDRSTDGAVIKLLSQENRFVFVLAARTCVLVTDGLPRVAARSIRSNTSVMVPLAA
jgi:hypothetical protein